MEFDKRLHGLRRVVWFGLLGVACGGRSSAADFVQDPVPSCIPGQQIACACPGELAGVQACRTDGTFGGCSCGSVEPSTGGTGAVSSTGGTDAAGGSVGGGLGGGTGGSGGSGGSPGSGGTGAAAGQGGSTGQPPVVVSNGPTELIDVFVGERGTYIVLSNAIVLVARDGQEIGRVTMPRAVTAAAFDDSRLGVADRAKLTVFDLDLSEMVSGDLVESCASAVMVSGSRFVCGPENDWDRIFYTYDTDTCELLASSDPYTYNGIPMRRVPGTDDFVAVTTNLSPSDFHLYSVLDTGEAVFINESPYHGDFSVSGTYGFDGAPPVHLVTHAGLLLRIYGEGCNAEESTFSSTCFTKDGELGTNTGGQIYLGMEGGGSGLLYTLTNPAGSSFSFDAACSEQGCLAQKIDVASRTVLGQEVVHFDEGIGEVIAFRHDPVTGSIVIGYRVGETYVSSNDPYPGYRVDRIDLP